MGNPLRILHVVVNMNRGGAETLLMNLYRNIDRSKIQFDFLTCKEGVFDQEIIHKGGKVHRIPYISDVGHFQYIKQLDTFFTNHLEYKIVHSHMDKMSGLVLRAAKKAGIPNRISHSHNTQSEGGISTRVYKWLSGKYILPNATDYIACSNSAAQWLFNEKSTKATILKNGIEYEQFAYSPNIRKQLRKELQLDEKTFVLGHVGRFCLQKNHSFLLDMFKRFNQLQGNTLLILVGDGPLREVIENKARELRLDKKVKFMGIRSDINRLLQAFDSFVFPSFHEGLPVTLIEAQASGLPCLISDRISKEVDMGMNLVEYASLSDLQDWVEKIRLISSRQPVRYMKFNTFSEKGYDIKESANEIAGFYLNAAEGLI
ncbi:MAG: glycosyltransferase family 1 protein [Bacillus sp. (in: Bacteria)]|nr:glycosyltransferase family 1 protein [Bacillus sp. (in: firmicutes)]